MRRLGIDLSYFFTSKMRYRTGWDFPTLVRYIYYGWACARGSYCCSSILISEGRAAQASGGERNRHFPGGLGGVPDCGAGFDRENVAVSTAASSGSMAGFGAVCTHFQVGLAGNRFSILCVCREPCLRFYSRTGCAIRRFILSRYRIYLSCRIVLYVICRLL